MEVSEKWVWPLTIAIIFLGSTLIIVLALVLGRNWIAEKIDYFLLQSAKGTQSQQDYGLLACKDIMGKNWILAQKYILFHEGNVNLTANRATWATETECNSDGQGYILRGRDTSYHKFQYNDKSYDCKTVNDIGIKIEKNGWLSARDLKRIDADSGCTTEDTQVQERYFEILKKSVEPNCVSAVGKVPFRMVIAFVCKNYTKVMEKT